MMGPTIQAGNTKKCKINSKRDRKNFSKILKKKIKIDGSGRTDAGVHSKNQSAHFDHENLILNKHKLISSVNHFLNKKNITIKKIIKKNKNFHARYSAKREYMNILF